MIGYTEEPIWVPIRGADLDGTRGDQTATFHCHSAFR